MTTKTNSVISTNRAASAVLLLVFWSYVSIPLAWGVLNTVKKAMALFN